MRGRDFLAVARDLSRQTTEAYWRAAAGRAYYAVLIELRDAMTIWGCHSRRRARSINW
jgi:hypothetical protein